VVSFLFDLEGYADSVQIPIGVAHGEPDGRPKTRLPAPGFSSGGHRVAAGIDHGPAVVETRDARSTSGCCPTWIRRAWR